jgi:hypothetical protein
VGVIDLLRGLAIRLAWVAIALLIAFGTAGFLATMSQPPGTPGRPELTWAGDAAMEPALDVATEDLRALSDVVDALGATARQALSQVVAGDADPLGQTIADGTLHLARVQALTDALEASLVDVPHTGPDWGLFVSAGLHRRYEQLVGTSSLAAGLEDDWASFSGRSLAATRLTTLLTRHDEETAAAARLGSEGKYQDALAQLDRSDATIAESFRLRDDLAGSTDVSTLSAWLERNAAYDAALRNLYEALIRSGARVTDPVRKAFDREQQARAQLPGDTRGLVVILSDVAEGGLNQAVIAIEEARGSLATALEVQEQLRDDPTPLPPG